MPFERQHELEVLEPVVEIEELEVDAFSKNSVLGGATDDLEIEGELSMDEEGNVDTVYETVAKQVEAGFANLKK